jgi:3-oxoadipate enol-lactonase
VLVHAGICDSGMWEPQWRTFPRAFRTLRYDMRGFGRSPLGAVGFSHARDLIALLDEQGFGDVALVGCSLGGRVALEVACAQPERVWALVLVDAGLPGHEWSEEVRRYGAAEEDAIERGDVEGVVDLNVRFWVDGPGRAPDAVDSALRAQVAAMQRRALELQLPRLDVEEDLLVADVAQRLGELRLSTLVLNGSEDVQDFHAIAERLAREIPGARRAVIEGAAHLPSLERPDAFDKLVLDFLAEAANAKPPSPRAPADWSQERRRPPAGVEDDPR